MGKLKVKKVQVPACGAGCDLCDDFDPCLERHENPDVESARIPSMLTPWELHDYAEAQARAAVALTRQERVFAE